jgi:hypothetical protein
MQAATMGRIGKRWSSDCLLFFICTLRSFLQRLIGCLYVFRQKVWRVGTACVHLCQLRHLPNIRSDTISSIRAVDNSKNAQSNPEEMNSLQAKIDILQAEKQKLEAELKSREEMMSNLLSFIQASK